MGSMIANKIGLAAEFRVMAELLLRGHNPAKSYLEEGPDIVLENGLRIEVKSSHLRLHRPKNLHHLKPSYFFTILGGRRKNPQNLTKCDYIILWCIDDDCFFLAPTKILKSSLQGIGIANISDEAGGKYTPYKNKWELLGEVK